MSSSNAGNHQSHELVIPISSDAESQPPVPLSKLATTASLSTKLDGQISKAEGIPPHNDPGVVASAAALNATDEKAMSSSRFLLQDESSQQQSDDMEDDDERRGVGTARSSSILSTDFENPESSSICFYLILTLLFVFPIVLVFLLVSIVIGVLIRMILDGVPSMKRPPLLIRHSTLLHQTSTIRKLGNVYKIRKSELKRKLWMITSMGIVVLAAITYVGIKKGKVSSLLGFPLWKWMLLLGFLTCGRIVPTLIFSFLHYVWPHDQEGREMPYYSPGSSSIQLIRGLPYYLYWLMDPIITVCYSASHLIIWSLYFQRQNGHDDHRRSVEIGTGTFVCLLAGSVLLLIKTILLLKWRADTIYERFSERIIRGARQLYFLAHVCGLHLSILERCNAQFERMANDTPRPSGGFDRSRSYPCISNKDHIFSKTIPIYDLRELAECFQELANLASSRDDDDEDVAELLERCKWIQSTDQPNKHIDKTDLINELEFTEVSATLFLQELGNNPSHGAFEKWMLNVRSNSLTLGYTLLDAKVLVTYLNGITNVVVFIVVVVAWLLITGVASTKVLVVIASPFLAATFIFGDMCKRVFEGAIFTFVSHPFIVGDKCLIEGNELEVKQMGVLRTRFENIRTKEKFSYSNAELASKVIIDLGEKLPTDDRVRLNLDSSTVTKSNIQQLKTMVESFVKGDTFGGFDRRRFDGVPFVWLSLGKIIFLENNPHQYTTSHEVIVEEIMNSTNVTISFKHQMHSHDVIMAKWLPQKRRQRSKFLEELNQILIDIGINRAST